jgi:catechol 2,3-dioxygenase-like lactoylglutathione lyase family enzyme
VSRGLDHIAHAVRDLDRAGELYARLGFTVGARNRHPWGTHNRIIQFPGVFIELVTFAEPEKLGSDGFSKLFAARNRGFAAAHDGLSMLILESRDAAGDAQEFQSAGIAASQVLHFEREGQRPDGRRVKVGFSLAFAEDRRAPEIGFATCQQHYPENFWNPAYQQHLNGARAVANVTLVAAEPDAHRAMLLAFTGGSEAWGQGEGYTIALARGSISVLTPQGFVERFGVAGPEPGEGARLAAISFELSELSALQSRLTEAGIPALRHHDALVIAPENGLGAILLFTPAG